MGSSRAPWLHLLLAAGLLCGCDREPPAAPASAPPPPAAPAANLEPPAERAEAAPLPVGALPVGATARLGTLSRRHPGGVTAALPAGEGRVLSAGRDGLLALWAPGQELPLFSVIAHGGGWVEAVALSADGRLALTGGADGAAALWTLPGGKRAQTFAGHDRGIRAVALDGAGALVVTAGRDGTVRLWDGVSGHERARLAGLKDGATALAVRAAGDLIATGSADGAVRLYAPDGSLTLAVPGERKALRSLRFSPDGGRLAGATSDGRAFVWEVETGAERLKARGIAAAPGVVAWGGRGERLATSAGREIRVLDAASGRALQTLDAGAHLVDGLAFTPEGDALIAACSDGIIRTLALKGEAQAPEGHGGPLTGIALDPRGAWIATAAADGILRLWSPEGALLFASPSEGDDLVDLAASRDGARLATLTSKGQLSLWDPAGRARLATADLDRRAYAVAFAPDGESLAVAGASGAIHRVSAADLSPLPGMEGGGGTLTSLAFTADGQGLVTAGKGGALTLLSLSGAPPKKTNAGAPVSRLIVGERGTLVVARNDGAVLVGLTDFSEPPTVLIYHRGAAHALALSADERWLVTGGADGRIARWSLPDGQRVGDVYAHVGGVNALAASPDGGRWVSAGQDTTGLVFQASAPAGQAKPETEATFGP